MPITQTSWLTNLTEQDLANQLGSIIDALGSTISSNNNNINDIVETQLISVKNEIAAISSEIANLSSSMPTSLIGSAADSYGTTTTGSVMGKLNYLIYLIAPTPSTFNYSSSGTYNNITIPTGVKFISVTACGGSGGGQVGSFYNAFQGDYRPYNYNPNYMTSNGDRGLLLETDFVLQAVKGVNAYFGYQSNNYTGQQDFYCNPGSYNYNAYGRRVNFLHSGSYNYWYNFSGSCYGTYNHWYHQKTIYKISAVAKTVTPAGGNAGITATVSSKSLNVAPSEIITTVVGAGGGNSASGAASSVKGTNGTLTFSGGATGAAGNTVVYSNWTTIFNGKVLMTGYFNRTGGANTFIETELQSNLTFDCSIVAPTQTTVTIAGENGKTASANSLGKKGGAGGKGATGSITYYTNSLMTTANFAGETGSNGDPGYVRVAW